ncbi:helix-turn-helix domain-containing protein [Lactobacillus taiwanensis]|uniref:helix-turn-helix domain-containing protein n=1 Tax=Lactobacillus taiwanensis TaxID=508451 RepID=UPI00242F9CF6|nr:helix-turn-helix transcriptional regulator [Lactobacillus taiwanensis]
MNNIKKLRENKKLTLMELSKEVQIPNNTLSQYENEKRKPKLETWQALADFFGVSVPYLQGAYSKDEINKKVIASYNEYFEAYNIKKLFLIVQPLNGWTIEDYLIAVGAVPFDTPKTHFLINKDQMEDYDFWKKNLEPIYKNVAVKWLLEKPGINATKEDVLKAVNSAMNTVIAYSSSTTVSRNLGADEIIHFDYSSIAENQFMHKRYNFLDMHEWNDDEELPDGSHQLIPFYDFNHSHPLDGEIYMRDEIK